MTKRATVKLSVTLKGVPEPTEAEAVAWAQRWYEEERARLCSEGVTLQVESIEADVDGPGGDQRE